MHSILQDFRYALRQLRKAPGFACATILILGLGIGATTAIFSAVNPILFEPLPYPHASRIMMIWDRGDGGQPIPQTFHTYQELAERSRSFETVAVMKAWQPTINGLDEPGADQPERIDGQEVSADYFRALGVTPATGRDFQPADDVVNGAKVVILSDGLWRRRFGGDRAILERPIKLDGKSYIVIGVMPAGFDNVLTPSSEAWSTLQYDKGNVGSPDTREWGHHLRMIGRLRADVSETQAKRELAWIASAPVAEFPRPLWANLSGGLIVDSLQRSVTQGARPALMAVFGAVILLLLIACVNVTNLMLGRGAQRRGEFALRSALGAVAPRLARQLVTESLLLAVFGCAVGLAVAQIGVRVLIALSPAGLPRVSAIRLDGVVMAFAFGVTVLIGLAIGLILARQASHEDLQAGLQKSSQRTTGGSQLTRRVFVMAEVALALVLTVSAGLLLRSLTRLLAVPPGFNAEHLLTMQVQTYGRKYDDDRICHQFFAQALDAVRQVPRVSAADFTSQLPLSGDSDVYGARFEEDGPQANYPVFRYAVTPEYFRTVGIPLRRGRVLDEHDVANAPRVIVISESLARRRFLNQDPIGKRAQVGGNKAPYTIVGVVGDVKQMSLGLSESDAVYMTSEQWQWADGTRSLVVRTRGDAAAVISAVKNAIWSVDRDQPIVRIALMDDLVAASAAERRFVLILFEAFGLVALVLATTGIYGVLSASVTERTREIGVRSALGAQRGSIVALVLRQGMTLTGFGVVVGLAGAVISSRAIAAMLFDVSCFDPVTYLGVVALLAAVSAVACSVPAWRAAKVDPMVALRCE
jgi:putative ABC transport system permease protein